jgi:hypothetical protein
MDDSDSQESENDKNISVNLNVMEYKGFQNKAEIKIKRMNRFSANLTNESHKGPGRMTQVAERPSTVTNSILEDRVSEYS